MTKREKCVTDGCNERKAFTVAFNDGCKGSYCEECKDYFEWQSKFFGLKSVKPLEVKKG
jgi:hypothetical protein